MEDQCTRETVSVKVGWLDRGHIRKVLTVMREYANGTHVSFAEKKKLFSSVFTVSVEGKNQEEVAATMRAINKIWWH